MQITLSRVRYVMLAFLASVIAVPASRSLHAQSQAASYDIVSSFGAMDGTPTGIIQTRSGQLYGTASAPAPGPPGAVGSLFAMNAAGGRTTLHTFVFVFGGPTGLSGDGTPSGRLFEGADGSVYGTSYNRFDSFIPPGQIYRVSPQGVYANLVSSHSLRAGVIQARDGRLYGVLEGTIVDTALRYYGSVVRVEANATLTTLHRFDGTDSANPVGELVQASDGTLYGVTEGGSLQPTPSGPLPPAIPAAIFRLDPATGAFAIPFRFPSGVKSAGRLIQATNGLLYGTTMNGGDFGLGTVFSLDAAGTFTTLHHFSGADGSNPSAGVIQAADGRLYGTTRNGGAFGIGTAFVMNVTGRATTLHDFSASDGGNPVEELFQAQDGSFFGIASTGGPAGNGVIFRLRPRAVAPDGYVEIVSRNSDRCLDVYGASTDPVAQAIQWTCHGGANQQWRLEPVSGGGFRVIARHSGQALDVFGASLDDVTPVIQYPVHGGDNQVWIVEPATDGYVTLVARHSGKAMDVEYASTADGARVIQYTPHGGVNQQWLLRPVGSNAPLSTSVSQH